MEKITIKHIGPIEFVDIELNKINIIMGPQSSGKSTIAKVISYCQWVEKRFILDGKYEDSFTKQFIGFHRIDENYFNEKSFIRYESDYVVISYSGTNYEQSIETKDNDINYLKSKNIYIPAERNFVSVIPNLGKYKETNDNIMSFLYDWYSTKRQYVNGDSFPVLNLGVRYHNTKETDADTLTISNNKEITLQNASSGLQSVTPLVLLVDYLTGKFYDGSHFHSIKELEHFLLRIEENGNTKLPLSILQFRAKYHYSRFIIEEPEQNLFPTTQRDLIYFLLEKMNDEERNHRLLLTTHSPYILYALNNCMMGFNVKDELDTDEIKELKSKQAWINPDKVSIWEVEEGKGTLKSIKDPTTGTVNKHYFNKIMNSLLDEYYAMLNHYAV